MIEGGTFEDAELQAARHGAGGTEPIAGPRRSGEAVVGRFCRSNSRSIWTPARLQPIGAGIPEPLIPKPKNMEEAQENMRVEFRIVRVPAEAIQESDFDF